jgi:ABC-type Fe3+/spermidine/putrescine transport system ATPase subunit
MTIQFNDISAGYRRGDPPVVADINLTVAAGEMLALLGPSGSGKSTLLKLIAGIEVPTQGDILLDGQSILALPPNKRAAVLMFQKAYLFPFMSVADNIGFGLRVQGIRRREICAEVARMLELVGLPGFERRFPAQLSGGEQQRVALARALVTRPRVLLLDEPFSSLDTAVRLNLQEAVRRIQRELGITSILVTHDLAEAMAMSDRTALLLQGRIVACAAPETLFRRPPTVAAARFVGVSTFLAGELCGGCLRTAWGPLEVCSHGHAAGPATFAIRPEDIELCGRTGPNTLPGVTREALYRGEYHEYVVCVGELEVRVRDYAAGQRFPPGCAVQLGFPAEKLFAVEMLEAQ